MLRFAHLRIAMDEPGVSDPVYTIRVSREALIRCWALDLCDRETPPSAGYADFPNGFYCREVERKLDTLVAATAGAQRVGNEQTCATCGGSFYTSFERDAWHTQPGHADPFKAAAT